MSRYYKTTFWERWVTGLFLMAPVTMLSSCLCGFLLMDDVKTGLLVWLGEDILFGFLLALCPYAEAFRKPWWVE
jgi:hypothetical protein